MNDDTAGIDQRGGRRPYVKPFVRNLDVMDTEGKPTGFPFEIGPTADRTLSAGPS